MAWLSEVDAPGACKIKMILAVARKLSIPAQHTPPTNASSMAAVARIADTSSNMDSMEFCTKAFPEASDREPLRNPRCNESRLEEAVLEKKSLSHSEETSEFECMWLCVAPGEQRAEHSLSSKGLS